MVRVGSTSFDGRTARVTVTVGADQYPIAIHSRTRIPRPGYWGDVWLPLALFPAMRTGADLHLTEPLSPGLARNVATVQRILSTFHPGLTPVEVHAPTGRNRRARGARSSMQTFTGGVDSFFTVGSHPEIDTLVYAHDLVFDVPEVIERITGLLDSAASDMGKRILHMESDVRSMLDKFGEWGLETHGAALSSIAALVSRGPTDFYIPASHTYLELYPRGSHAALDHWWGSDSRRILHDGAHASRFEKIQAIAANPVALHHLRVCWVTTTEINCSRCEKCVRTMIALDVAGVLDQATTFRGPVTPELIRSIPIKTNSDMSFAMDNLDAAKRAGRDDIARPLGELVAAYDAG